MLTAMLASRRYTTWYGNTKMISGVMFLSTAAVLVEKDTLIVTVLNTIIILNRCINNRVSKELYALKMCQKKELAIIQ